MRLPSEEVDYGGRRRLDGWEYRRRTSYVRTTGEVCAVNQGSTIGPAFILGGMTRPELTQLDVDRWMEKYDPEWDWQEDAATDAQMSYPRSLLRQEGPVLGNEDAASMTGGWESRMIDRLTEGRW